MASPAGRRPILIAIDEQNRTLASMPMRHGGIAESRVANWPRDHFWARRSRHADPDLTAIPELSLCDIACSSSSAPLASFACWRGRSTGSLIDHLAVIFMAA